MVMNNSSKLGLFSGFGIEMEYMIVDRNTLNVLPIADQLIHSVLGEYDTDVERGSIAWSNEFVLHVIELKTNGPAPSLSSLDCHFHENVQAINQYLKALNGQLLPTGAHPWMNPAIETVRWPHSNQIIYDTYHQIFNASGHGFANLQSVHLNLPFANETEFVRLHTAIRLLLPIMPALTASTPILDSKLTGFFDARLTFYGKNQIKVPSISGNIIPEFIQSIEQYHQQILNPMYQEIAPFDKKGILQHEWLNSRGAIARFDRDAIEIRILDIQECPLADLAAISLIVAVLQQIVALNFSPLEMQSTIPTDQLRVLFDSVVCDGMQTKIQNPQYLQALGFPEPQQTVTAKQLWQHLFGQVKENIGDERYQQTLMTILSEGNLSERIVAALDNDITHDKITAVYRKLGACLSENRLFMG